MKKLVSGVVVLVLLGAIGSFTLLLDEPAAASDPTADCNCPTWCPLFCPAGTECVCSGPCMCCECASPSHPAESEAVASDAVQEAVPVADEAARGCKPCKGRKWCECTYEGHPRISCDPCCYDAQPYPICLD